MVEVNNKSQSQIDVELIKKTAEKFLEAHKIGHKKLSIALVGERTIRRLNREYRQVDRVTDILAFPGEGRFLGELVVCWAQIKRQAGKFGNTDKQELVFILVHGLYHLLGYRDDTEEGKEEMDGLAKKFLKNFGFYR